MTAADVQKALKSVAVTCDGDDGDGAGEAHVLFTKHGGKVIYLRGVQDKYTIDKSGNSAGTVGVMNFERTGFTYGMDAWVCMDDIEVPAEGFSRPEIAP